MRSAVAAIALVALPLETAYAFERLFRVNGTNGLPITLDQGVVFNWIDRNVGADGRVTVVKYPVGGPDWWAGQAYWWDAEFWNESAVEVIGDMSLKNSRHWSTLFDPRTGRAHRPGDTRYVVVYGQDVRFRTRGPPAPLRARRVPVRSGTSMARGLGRLGHLRRRLVAAAGSSHVHRLRAAGAEAHPWAAR